MMRRVPFRAATVAIALAAVAAPASASAQLHLLMEAGLSWPSGYFAKRADPGYHGGFGLQARLPHVPLSLRAEGDAGRYTNATSAGHVTVVGGSGSAILWVGRWLGGSPYVLAGIGQYRTSFSEVGMSSSIGTGYHVGGGLSFGAVGYGGLVEVRLVDVDGDLFRTRYFSIAVGLHL